MTMAATCERAMQVADKVTARLACINRALRENPPKMDPLSPEIRERVCTALDAHMERCEG